LPIDPDKGIAINPAKSIRFPSRQKIRTHHQSTILFAI